jgi:lysyl-tRNA synthetase class 2
MRDIHQIAKEREMINDTIRSFFKRNGYSEVETPIVVRSPGMEPNLTPFETFVVEPDGAKHSATLITSPEYSMKKLLGLGMEKIFTITKVFRNEEEFAGTHNPEFSMLEWYQQGADYQACIDETEKLVRTVKRSLDSSDLEAGLALDDMWKRIRIRDLFLEHIGVDLDAADKQTLQNVCAQRQINTTQSDTESDLFYRLFLTVVEPKLSTSFLYDYPKYQASLARLTMDGKYGERFELYMNGLEICNGFTELTDATQQRGRFVEEAEERQHSGKIVHPIDEEFLHLLPSLRSPTFGNALGIDRLQMALTGRKKIEEVTLFPMNQLFFL